MVTWGQEMLQGGIDRKGCRESVLACPSRLAGLTAPNQLAPANLGMTFPLVNSAAASTACLLSPPLVPLTSVATVIRCRVEALQRQKGICP